MKKIFTILLSLLCTSMAYSVIYEYVDESGRSFFYRTSKAYYPKGEKQETMDEINFIGAQVISCSIESFDPNYNRQEMIEELKHKYKDMIRDVYNKNKTYMETNFPDHTYTLDEVYDFAYKVSSTSVYIGYGSECYLNISFCIRHLLLHEMEEVKKHPYILGYLYKEVKYSDGKKCKIQHMTGVRIN